MRSGSGSGSASASRSRSPSPGPLREGDADAIVRNHVRSAVRASSELARAARACASACARAGGGAAALSRAPRHELQQRKTMLRRSAAAELGALAARARGGGGARALGDALLASLPRPLPLPPSKRGGLPVLRNATVHAPLRSLPLDEAWSQRSLRRRLGGETRVHITPHELCIYCRVRLLRSLDASTLACSLCGHTEPYVDTTLETLPYGDERDFTSFYYKRMGHFNNVMNAFQAKELSRMPLDIVYLVALRLASDGARSPRDVTMEAVRGALKRLGQTQHYKRATQIICRITGGEPPTHTPAQEETLRGMFGAFAAQFDRMRGTTSRINMLAYKYLHYKFCELQGFDEFLPHISLLKGRAKLLVQEGIYFTVCSALGWEFYPSLP
jgi:hypothetical protein